MLSTERAYPQSSKSGKQFAAVLVLEQLRSAYFELTEISKDTTKVRTAKLKLFFLPERSIEVFSKRKTIAK